MEKYELTNPQKSIWYTEEVFKNTTINNICTSGTIYEKIDEELLKKAINKVVKEHDSFRIHLCMQDGVPFQYIAEYKDFDIDIEYINNKTELENLEAIEAKEHFALLDSDLFKFKIAILKDKFACVILTVNHIIADSWSMGITIQEIIKNYHCLQNKTNAFEENTGGASSQAFSYIDYLNSEVEYKNSKKYEADKKYWNDEFSTIPEIATIPSMNTSAISFSSDAKRADFSIDRDLVEKINSFCKVRHISPFTFFMAIFSIYIGRVSGAEDFVIGTPILNRVNPREKQTTGMFVNTVPVRVNGMADGAFTDFASSISKKMMGILRHQKYSYNSILEDLRTGNQNLPNLYNIAISYQVTKAFDETIGNYETKWTFSDSLANDMNIHIFDINDTGSLQISYDYLTAKYDDKAINDLHSRILYMIEQVLKNNNILVNEMQIVTEEEKNELLYKFNDTKTDYPRNHTIATLFEEQARQTPENIAIVFENEQLTYKEFNEKSNRLARFLIENGVKPHDNVVILGDKSIDLYISIMAILKAGALYVPVDSEFPKERIDVILDDCKPKMVIVDEKYKHLINHKNICTLPIQDLSKYAVTNLESVITPVDGAYIIYTSGSTGKPKGVIVPHRGVVRLVKNTNYIEFKKADRILQNITIVFDASVFAIFGAFLNGLPLYPIGKDKLLDFEYFERFIKENKITIINFTVSLYNKMIEYNNKIFDETRCILIGGETLLPRTINALRTASPHVEIVNVYGPTENSDLSCCHIIKKDYEKAIPIGKPVSNSSCYILDKHQNLLPVGVPGEIFVGGDGVALGYLNRPELSAEKFIHNKFGEGKLYRTGDLGYWEKDGVVQFISRIDDQTKIRGYRIELKEIEAKIFEFGNIKECAVIIAEHASSKILVACIGSNESIDTKKLSEFLKTKLPFYMVPSKYVCLQHLPLTINGKLDTRQLLQKVSYVSEEIVLPRNDIDAKLIDLLKNLLSVDTISIDDSFFDLGGDSLSAINFAAEVKSVFDVQLFVKDIMENPVVQDLADMISAHLGKNQTQVIQNIPKAEYYPLSSSQKRIYLTCQIAGTSSTLYNIPGAVILDGNVDIEKLEKCIDILIDRHEALRTYFENVDGNIVQKIVDKLDFKLDVAKNCDFKNIDSLFKEFVKPFDLSKAPLFRAKFIQFTNSKSALFIDMHHIISDGMSLAIFTDELCLAYNGETLPEIKITYKDYAVFENNATQNGSLKEAEDYWLKQFSDEIPVLNMPTIFPRPAVQSYDGKKVYSTIDNDTVQKIESLCHELNITPYMLLLSCYYILLSKYTSQDDIIVGSPIVGRDLSETYNLIGMFVNSLALRNKVDNNLSFKDFVLNLKENILEAFKYQNYPFDELVNKLNIKRDTSRNPLFDTMFIYQNNGYKELKLNDISAEYYIPDTHVSKFDLSLEAVPHDDNINLSFEYSTSLFDEKFIKNLSEHYLNILNFVLKNADIKLADIDMLSIAEKNKILHEFNDTVVDFPSDKTVVELFEEQVERTPNAIAIEFENKNITYIDFNRKVNKLARYLRNIGVGRGDFVAIIAKRGLEMMIGIFGIIKAGAAYVPIDPNYPEDRKNHILEDSNPKVILLSHADIKSSIPRIDLCKEEYKSEKDTNLEIINKPEDAVYCIYTSGTTGKPKGVVNKHIGLINRIMWMNSKYPIKEGDVILQKTTYCFDVSVWEIVWWSFVGARVCLLKPDGEKDPEEILKAIEINKITTIHFVPSMLNMMLIYLENAQNLGDKLKTLKYVFTSGEELKKKQVEIFYERIKSANESVKLINVYGPTEASIDVTYFECQKDNDLIPIGKPISNIQMYILDGLKLCGIGISGEICIGGVGVAKGYLNRDDLNKEKFIDNPYGEGKLYRTGDLGRWLEDGNIQYIGRIDHQVKIRGLRIELDEIENIILKEPHIKNVAAIKQTIQNRDFISCYYVADKRINSNELRKHIAKFLPQYMVPSYFIAMDDLPYSPNGKLNRKALPLPTEILNISEKKYVPPTTKLQRQLVYAWEKVLNTKPISINDNFFELGGDSLLAMSLNLELQKISNNISYADIFRFPTILEQEEKINSNDNKLYLSKIQNISDSFIDILKDSRKRAKIKVSHQKNILLTGCTGFLGIHVLEQFLKKEKGNIYCIIRDEPGITSRTKLHQKLNYYFGDKYDDFLDKRIFVYTGDVTKLGFSLNQDDILEVANSIDVVINCAANVSHYGNYNDFYNSNVKSVENIIDFCKSFGKKLYHISTMSVSGTKLDTSYPAFKKPNIIKFNESCLYVGQMLENVYVHSKFEAEIRVLQAISGGLDGFILRVGNLMPRYKDGFFQENLSSNAFLNRIMSFMKIGVIPDYILDEPLEFTPVDYTAKAICKLVTHSNSTNRIFHLYNQNYTSIKKLINRAKKLDFNIEVLPETEFKIRLKEILNSDNSKNKVEFLLNDLNNDLHLDYKYDIIGTSSFTIKYLRRTLFRWPNLSNKYLTRFIKLLRKVI